MTEVIPIENKVANSQLVTIDLQDYLGSKKNSKIDIANYLENGLVLREREFRAALKEEDWSFYEGHNVLLFCSSEAIIPAWAYMLLVSKLRPFADVVVSGDQDDLEKNLIRDAVEKIPLELVDGKKVVVKGCGDVGNRDFAYTEISKKLIPLVDSLMYGEPCSTVPVYKKPRKSTV